MSIKIIEKNNCFDYESNRKLNHHSICVGKKCAWCMDCGKIIIWYNKKEDFKKLMNPFD